MGYAVLSGHQSGFISVLSLVANDQQSHYSETPSGYFVPHDRTLMTLMLFLQVLATLSQVLPKLLDRMYFNDFR